MFDPIYPDPNPSPLPTEPAQPDKADTSAEPAAFAPDSDAAPVADVAPADASPAEGISGAAPTEQVSDNAPAESEAAPFTPPPCKKRRLLPLFILIGALILLLSGGGVLGFVMTRPEVIARQAVGGYFSGIGDDLPFMQALTAAQKNGKIALKLDNPELVPAPLTFDLFMNSRKGTAVGELALEDDYLRVFASEDELIAESSVFGEDLFGTSAEDLVERFQNSIFHPASGSEYALELSDDELDVLETYFRQMENAKEIAEQEEALMERYSKYANELLLEHATFTLTRSGSEYVVEMHMTDDGLSDYLEEFCTTVATDDELCEFLNENYPPVTITDEYGFEETYDDYSKLLADLKPGVMAFCELVEESDLELTVRITANRFTRKLQMLSATLASESEQVLKLILDVEDPYVTEITVMSENIVVMKSTLVFAETATQWTLEAVNDAGKLESVITVTLEYRDGGAYTLTIYSEDNGAKTTITLQGSLVENRRHFLFSIDTAETKVNSDITSEKIGLTVEIIPGQRMPSFPKEYRDVLALTVDEAKTLESDLAARLEELEKRLEDLFKKLEEDFAAEV